MAGPRLCRAEARLRLHYVLPGEKAYIVLGRAKPKSAKAGQTPATPAVTGAWYARLWQTVQLAGAARK